MSNNHEINNVVICGLAMTQ